MNVIGIKRELDNVTKRLSRLIIDVNYYRSERVIAWPDYIPGIHNHVNYYYEYRWIIDNRQFSMLLKDGGALQFYYYFEDRELVSSRQCYYPPPFEGAEESVEVDAEITLDDLLSVNVSPDDPPKYRAKHWSHIRFDFDSKVMTHDKSHLQYSAVNLFRVPADKVLAPFVFIDMVLHDFYPNEYANHYRAAWYQGLLRLSARNGLASHVGRVEAVRISCP